jgi:hypothetical protein
MTPVNKHIPKPNKKPVIPKLNDADKDNNLAFYSYFFLSFISLILIVNILFQKGITNPMINRSWGLNNFSYFPWWIQALVFIILFALAIPVVNYAFRLFIQKLANGIKEKFTGKFKKTIWFIGISALITFLFYLFRVKYDLLGDMNLRVSQTVDGKYVDDEYLTMYLMHYLNVVLQNLLHFTPHRTFVFASIASGFFFCFLGLLIADLLFEDVRAIIVFFLFYMSIGTILFFCGYTEIYAIPAASVSLYMYAALLYLKKKASIILPFLCMVLAVELHKEQISVLPSFIFLATRKMQILKKLDAKIILILFLISIPLIYVLNGFLNLQSLMPLVKDKQVPELNTLFSFSYWWELFNSQYISSGILLFLFVFIFFKTLKGQIKLDDYSKFLLITVLFIYSIIFTMNKERGSGDWDVCSFPAIYLNMFVGYIALTQWESMYSQRKLFYILSIALLLNTFSCWAWVGLNSGKKSLDKVENMLLTDPGYYYKVYMPSESEIAFLYNKYGMHNRAREFYRESYEKYKRQYRFTVSNYAGILVLDGDTDKATPVYEDAVALYPDYLTEYFVLFGIYDKRKQYEKTYNLAKLYVAAYERNTENILNNEYAKNILANSVNLLYQSSLARNDTTVNRDAVMMMKQLGMKMPP